MFRKILTGMIKDFLEERNQNILLLISICESVFNDRLLAIELAQILSDANIGTDKILNMLKAHSEEIFSCLDSYPEYFKDRLSVLMK